MKHLFINHLNRFNNINNLCKLYNNEKGIISLTSWRARINTVYKTIKSLLLYCSNYHIVLVLSEDEFPKKEKELPNNLLFLMDYFEILWVKKNYKSMKKVIFTMKKYIDKNVPVISADDDCLYLKNYADELYEKYIETNGEYVIRYNSQRNEIRNIPFTQGPSTLYPSNVFKMLIKSFDDYSKKNKMLNNDDIFLTETLKKNKIEIIALYPDNKFPFIFHDEFCPLNDNRKKKCYNNCYLFNLN